MKKWLLYLTMLCSIPAAVHAQKKTIVGSIEKPPAGLESNPPANKSGCAEKCPAGMSCDGACCMYPTKETSGNWNYIIYNKCDAIKDLHMRFEVTKQFTAEYDEVVNGCGSSVVVQRLTSTYGIVIQFNCFSPDAPGTMIQYIFYVWGLSIFPHIQYFGGTPDKIDHDWPSHGEDFYGLRLFQPVSLPQGFVFEVDLGCDDKGYVNGATFTVTEPDGKKHVQQVPNAALFPLRLTEFQTNIVSTNGKYVHYAKESEGTLSYSSKDGLYVEGGNDLHCPSRLIYTCETSNAAYGKLSSCSAKPGEFFHQSVTCK